MKNNKIFNRTFKISLVTAALGLVNSALAADVACNSSGVTITGPKWSCVESMFD